jgi:sigma-B regulation protein RsbU (phosphoserine phosphatase)
MLDVPRGVAESLYSVVYAQRSLAYLHVDGDLKLIGAGGHLANYGLENLRLGEPASEQAVFIEGFLPLAESPFFVRAMEFPGGHAADLQFYADGDDVWIVLVDVTAERDATRRMQQKAYEMTLLQEKEERLNRSLQAANAALRAAQTEIERSRAALAVAFDRLEGELAEAAVYVRSILPAPMDSPFAADWRFVPSARLGGDAFGYHWVDAQHFAIYLLDVCGHGVRPSLLSIGVLNALRTGSLPNVDFRDPSQVLAALNAIYQMERHDDLYFTIWYGVYQPAARALAFAGAGHPPSLLLHPAGTGAAEIDRLQGEGPAIGFVPAGNWPTRELDIAPGSRLYVISDGTYEIGRPDGSMMGMDDLIRFFRTAPTRDGADLDHLLEHVRLQHGSAGLEDDFSIIRLEF